MYISYHLGNKVEKISPSGNSVKSKIIMKKEPSDAGKCFGEGIESKCYWKSNGQNFVT